MDYRRGIRLCAKYTSWFKLSVWTHLWRLREICSWSQRRELTENERREEREQLESCPPSLP